MILSSYLKSFILPLLDSKPAEFMRGAVLDPATPSIDELVLAAEGEITGFVRDGVYVAQKPNDMGDACIWQGVYTAMCVFRWKAKKDEASRVLMVEAAKALSKYVRAGVLYRGAMPEILEGVLFHRDVTKKYMVSDGYVYRDDASLDSLLGFCFGAATINAYGDEDAKAAILNAITTLSVVFSDKGYKLINWNDTPTRFGDCQPGAFQAPVRTLAACLPSLVAGGEAWKQIASKYAAEFSVTDTQIPRRPVSWVNAHLAILANLTYVIATKDGDPGRSEARQGLYRLLDKYADAGNAFLIFGCVAARVPVTSGEWKIADIVLSEFPLGSKPKAGTGVGQSSQPVPVWQRPPSDVVWQRNPYSLSGAESNEYNRLDFLGPFYMREAFS